MKPSIVIVDDKDKLLTELAAALNAQIGAEAEIRTWLPKAGEDPQVAFNARIDSSTALVVTDYDLTTQGQTGLFGATIVSWCQSKAIRVGDFSRGNVGNLPKEPNLFEIRIPGDVEKAAPFVAGVYRGFRQIREALSAEVEVLKRKRSPSAVLAEILGVSAAEGQFALYGQRLGTANTALMESIVRTAPEEIEPTEPEKSALLTYLIGHLLLNSVLRFSGPILSDRALLAYLGTDDSETSHVLDLFSEAAYSGPFSGVATFFWLSKIDDILEQLRANLPPQFTAETRGGFNRGIVEAKLGRSLSRHKCKRCEGANGGFLCPFTKRTVCERSDCSVGSSSWIPQGAVLCRIEREFYDEWSPILGI